MKPSIADLRRDYTRDGLTETQAPAEPFALFGEWFAQAVEVESTEANAMMLATVDGEGQPHLRTLLLKGFDERGFVFFTNYQSAKGQQLASSPAAAMTSRPVTVPPVKLTRSMAAWPTRCAPVTVPRPFTRFKTPSGSNSFNSETSLIRE